MFGGLGRPDASMTIVYKIFGRADWLEAASKGVFSGSADDRRDGYIHLSTAAQLEGTLRKHFAKEKGLMIAALDSGRFGEALAWKESRGGELFPHLYEILTIDQFEWVRPVRLLADCSHLLPELV